MLSFGIILASASFIAFTLAAAVPANIAIADVNDVTITAYPEGLPRELVPGEAANGSMKKRADAGVYLCNDSYFNGYCVHIIQPQFQCVSLSGDLNNKVSSLGPDSPYYCLFYS
ncbi:hypothetical protein F5B21DRAFT_502004 [Xylaria acuta]|nr:hypothetical protein F5B21DRAFT_502004 [Xylaria acuta]